MILVLGGTKEGREIIKLLLNQNKKVIASVVSDYGYNLLSGYGIKINKGKLDTRQMKKFIIENKIDLIIDATHPFAEIVSRNAMEVCNNRGIKYLRYEREEIEIGSLDNDLLIPVKGFEEGARRADAFNKILLTTGSNNLDIFTDLITNWQKKLIVRVLPYYKYLKKLYQIGFSPANIIAIQGPFSKEFNQTLIRDYKIDVLLTKASGKIGGADTKIQAAFAENIPVILIKRPEIDYKQVVRTYQQLMTVIEGG